MGSLDSVAHPQGYLVEKVAGASTHRLKAPGSAPGAGIIT